MNVEQNFGFERHNPNHRAKLKEVLAKQGPARWRAASDLYLMLNPSSKVVEDGVLYRTIDARTARTLAMKDAADIRQELDIAGNAMGKSTNDDSGRRWGLHMPPGELQFIELIDPDLMQGTPQERKDSFRKLVAEFKEYAVIRII